MLIRKIARPLLSAFFIADGIGALRERPRRAAEAAPLIDKSVDVLPDAITEKVPTDPGTLVIVNAAVQIGGGVLLASGKAPRIAALALAGSLVPSTLAGHDFWNETDPASRARQRIGFAKNVSLLGGLMIAAVDTEGRPSLGWRGRRAARKAQASISAALPVLSTHGDQAGDRVSHALSVASDRGSELAGAAGEVAERALEQGGEWVDTAAEQAQVLGRRARSRAEAALEKLRAQEVGPLRLG